MSTSETKGGMPSPEQRGEQTSVNWSLWQPDPPQVPETFISNKESARVQATRTARMLQFGELRDNSVEGRASLRNVLVDTIPSVFQETFGVAVAVKGQDDRTPRFVIKDTVGGIIFFGEIHVEPFQAKDSNEKDWKLCVKAASSKGELSEPLIASAYQLPDDMVLAIAEASGIGLVPGEAEINQSRIATIDKQITSDALQVALLNDPPQGNLEKYTTLFRERLQKLDSPDALTVEQYGIRLVVSYGERSFIMESMLGAMRGKLEICVRTLTHTGNSLPQIYGTRGNSPEDIFLSSMEIISTLP